MPTDFQSILELDVPVIVQIGRRQVDLSEVLGWGPGAIIELDKHADDELGLHINNIPIGSGHAVKVGENFGIRINDLASPADRIRAIVKGRLSPPLWRTCC